MNILREEQEKFETRVNDINSLLAYKAEPAFKVQEVLYFNNSCFFATAVSMMLADATFRHNCLPVPHIRDVNSDLKSMTMRAIKVCLNFIASGTRAKTGNDFVSTLMDLVSFVGVSEKDGVKVEGPKRTVVIGFMKLEEGELVPRGHQDDVGVAMGAMRRALGTAMNMKMAAISTMTYTCKSGHTSAKPTKNTHDLRVISSTFDDVATRGYRNTVASIVNVLVSKNHETETPGRMCESCAKDLSRSSRESIIRSIIETGPALERVVLNLANEKFPGRGLDNVYEDGVNFVDFISSLKARTGPAIAKSIEADTDEIVGGTEAMTYDLVLNVGDLMFLDLGMTTLDHRVEFEEQPFWVHSASGKQTLLSIVALAVKTGIATSGHWFSIVKNHPGGWSVVDGSAVTPYSTLEMAVEYVTRDRQGAIPYVMLKREDPAKAGTRARPRT